MTHEPLKASAKFSIKCNLKHLLWFIGRILCPSVLFTHFLEHLFAPIVGRFDEPNMGLPILGTVPRELLFLGYIILQIPQRKTLGPRKNEGSY